MNNVDNTMKNLLYLIAAAVLILFGLFIIAGIIKVAVGIIVTAFPLVLLAAGGYLIYRWWQSRYGQY